MQLCAIVVDSLRKKYMAKKFKKIPKKPPGAHTQLFGHFCAAENLRSLNVTLINVFFSIIKSKKLKK